MIPSGSSPHHVPATLNHPHLHLRYYYHHFSKGLTSRSLCFEDTPSSCLLAKKLRWRDGGYHLSIFPQWIFRHNLNRTSLLPPAPSDRPSNHDFPSLQPVDPLTP